MNIWYLLYVAFHGGILVLLFLDLLFQYGRGKLIKPAGQNIQDAWEFDRNKARAHKFFTRSMINFVIAFAGEALSFFLLWQGGWFD